MIFWTMAALAEEPLAIPAPDQPRAPEAPAAPRPAAIPAPDQPHAPPPAPAPAPAYLPQQPPDHQRFAVGLSAGLGTGFGPSVRVPIGDSWRLQLTALPVILPESTFVTGGLRAQQIISESRWNRLYATESVGGVLIDEDLLIGVGAGVGVESGGGPTVVWADLSITGVVADDWWGLLPLPQVGVAWEF